MACGVTAPCCCITLPQLLLLRSLSYRIIGRCLLAAVPPHLAMAATCLRLYGGGSTARDTLATAALQTYGVLHCGTPDERWARLAAAAAAAFHPCTLAVTGVVDDHGQVSKRGVSGARLPSGAQGVVGHRL